MIEIKEEQLGHYFKSRNGVIYKLAEIYESRDYPYRFFEENTSSTITTIKKGFYIAERDDDGNIVESAEDIVEYLGPNYLDDIKESNRTMIKKDVLKIDSPDNLIIQERVGHYFRTRDGKIFKLIHLLQSNAYSAMFVDRDNKGFMATDLLGNFSPSGIESSGDIIEYIGPKLEEPLREFKFQAYLGEDLSCKPRETSVMEIAFGHRVGSLVRWRPDLIHNWEKKSKWEVTMKEIKE